MKKIVRMLIVATMICMMLPLTAMAEYNSETGEYMNGQDYANACDIQEGYYIIHPDGNANYCLGITSEGLYSSSKGNLVLQSNDSKTNVFKIEKATNVNAYKIVAVNYSGYVLGLEIGTEDIKNGTNIAPMSDLYGLWYQRWVFFDAGNGCVTCRTYAHALPAYMDLKDGKAQAGQNIQVCNKSGNQNQKWRLEKIDMDPGLKGAGTANNPYLITSSDDLTKLANKVADGSDYAGKHFKLTGSFTYNGTSIGSIYHPFNGIFDGNGNTLTVNISKNETCTGLFAETKGATIKNLEIKGNVTGTNCVGGIVGHAYTNTNISNCHVTANVKGTAENIGGVVGMLYDNSTISNCQVDGKVEGGWTTTGGIVGWLHENCCVLNCVKTGETKGEAAVGGIAGYAQTGDDAIVNCASFGSVTGTSNCGGIMGLISSNINTFSFYSCYANCSVQCNDGCGYICGKSEKGVSDLWSLNLYFVKTGDQTSDAVFSSDIAVEVNSSNLSTALDNLNYFANAVQDTITGVTLTTWSQDGNNIRPVSCQGFETAQTGFTLSAGNLWIIGIGAVVIIGSVAALIIVNKKKKMNV
ncbi:MAG: hypothetical protein KBS79_04135 [Lachnospiraceae bacterium]|nr:hypothetical protein [Candidatus Minthocola equi]